MIGKKQHTMFRCMMLSKAARKSLASGCCTHTRRSSKRLSTNAAILPSRRSAAARSSAVHCTAPSTATAPGGVAVFVFACVANVTEWTLRGRVHLQYHAGHMSCSLLCTGFVEELGHSIHCEAETSQEVAAAADTLHSQTVRMLEVNDDTDFL